MNCRHHGACPGCSLLSLPYEAQLQQKRERLIRALSRYPHLALPEPKAIVPAVRQESYRHRLKLPVYIGDRNVSIGLYDKNHRVLVTPDCPVLAEPLRQAMPALKSWLSGRKEVHSIDLRVSHASGALSLVLAVKGGSLSGGARARRELGGVLP